jgi:cell division protein FtsI (penicillin-binding protein 3)
VLVRPHIVKERRDVLGNTTWTAPSDSIRRAFARETASTILPAFEKVVDAGTAEQALVSGLRIAGKTGTAKKTRNGAYVDGLYRATFVGFYPVEHPEVVLIVIMDEPKSSIYGGSVSAPVFQRVTERWLGTMPSHAGRFAQSDTSASDAVPVVPDVTGMPASVARRRLKRQGLAAWSVRNLADEAPVGGQSPEPGVPEGEVRQVTLKTPAEAADAPTLMPDVTGMGAREAFFWLDSEGVQVKLEGHGRVVRQSPAAGKALSDQVVLYCR